MQATAHRTSSGPEQMHKERKTATIFSMRQESMLSKRSISPSIPKGARVSHQRSHFRSNVVG